MECAAKMQNEVAKILKYCCRNTEVFLQKSLNSVIQRIWFTSAFAIDVSGCAQSCHGVPMQSASTWSWPSLRGQGDCPGTCPWRMGTWNHQALIQGIPHQREAEAITPEENFHHWLRNGGLFHIRQLPNWTSTLRWRVLPASVKPNDPILNCIHIWSTISNPS